MEVKIRKKIYKHKILQKKIRKTKLLLREIHIKDTLRFEDEEQKQKSRLIRNKRAKMTERVNSREGKPKHHRGCLIYSCKDSICNDPNWFIGFERLRPKQSNLQSVG